MSYRVQVRRAAELDVAEALEWHESQQRKLASEFFLEFERIIDCLAAEPHFLSSVSRYSACCASSLPVPCLVPGGRVGSDCGQDYFLSTTEMASIPISELGEPSGNLVAFRHSILAAVDLIFAAV